MYNLRLPIVTFHNHDQEFQHQETNLEEWPTRRRKTHMSYQKEIIFLKYKNTQNAYLNPKEDSI